MADSYELEPESKSGGSAPAGGSSSAAPKGRIEKPSLMQSGEGEVCPRCGAAMGADSVFCVKCGYDLRMGKTAKTTVGVEEVEAAPPAAEEFVKPSRVDVNPLVVVGGVLTVAAMVAAGIYAPAGSSGSGIIASVALALLDAVIQTGTGVLAVAFAAMVLKQPLGRVDLAAARIFVAFAAFLLIINVRWPTVSGDTMLLGLVNLARFAVAAAVYWGLVMLLFKKSPKAAGYVGAGQAILFCVVHLAMWLEAALHAAAVVAPAK